jgi:hypothetical protein
MKTGFDLVCNVIHSTKGAGDRKQVLYPARSNFAVKFSLQELRAGVSLPVPEEAAFVLANGQWRIRSTGLAHCASSGFME